MAPARRKLTAPASTTALPLPLVLFAPPIKKNHGLVIIPGLWSIRLCNRCGAVYARAGDLLVPGLLPDQSTVEAFAKLEGVPVEVEGAPHLKVAA